MQLSILLCLIDIAAGMSYLHSIGLLHSDLKGGNVLMKSCAPTKNDPRGFVCKVLCHRSSFPELSLAQRLSEHSRFTHVLIFVMKTTCQAEDAV